MPIFHAKLSIILTVKSTHPASMATEIGPIVAIALVKASSVFDSM